MILDPFKGSKGHKKGSLDPPIRGPNRIHLLTFEEPGDDTVDVELVPLLRLGPLAPKHLVRFHLTHLSCQSPLTLS